MQKTPNIFKILFDPMDEQMIIDRLSESGRILEKDPETGIYIIRKDGVIDRTCQDIEVLKDYVNRLFRTGHQ